MRRPTRFPLHACGWCGQNIRVDTDFRLFRHKPHGGHKDGPNCIGSGEKFCDLDDEVLAAIKARGYWDPWCHIDDTERIK